MYKLVLHFLLVKLALTSESFDILDTLNMLSPPILKSHSAGKLDLTESFFTALEGYQVNAKPAAESNYPWIARVIHSRSADVPQVCTAVCIDEAIFITAARCIYTLHHSTKVEEIVEYMRVKTNWTLRVEKLESRHNTNSKSFVARVFVVPSKPTKQMFDDIGIIVVDTKKVKNMNWAVIELFNVVNRTDEAFQWFEELNKNGNIQYKVLGYTVKKGFHKFKTADLKYDLTELNVVAALDICFKILLERHINKRNGFGVPCYHSCTFEEFYKNNEKCKGYHGVEGGAVVDTTSNKLIGIATWGSNHRDFELPVGFSIVNSENFFKDLTCAKRIRGDNGMLVTKGYYQSLCDGDE